MYRATSLAVVVREVPGALSIKVTVPPAITAPIGSVICQDAVPVAVDCAHAEIRVTPSNNATQASLSGRTNRRLAFANRWESGFGLLGQRGELHGPVNSVIQLLLSQN